MRFSELYRLSRSLDETWFDPILTVDTRLFIDPFLLYATEEAEFTGSHAEVIAFFNVVFNLVAESAGNPTSLSWQRAVDLLRFPEVKELCLGYTGVGTSGSGSGTGLARVIADALWDAVQAGVSHITHFEQVAILRQGIGADRISDITACLLRARLAAYTQAVCELHEIPASRATYRDGAFNASEERWEPLIASLPGNPYSATPILLVPERYLRSLPTIDPFGFWDYCVSNENDVLRREYSRDVLKRVRKRHIIEFARRHLDLCDRYVRTLEAVRPAPYNLSLDPQGLVKWYEATAEYCQAHALHFTVSSPADFTGVVDGLIDAFKAYVEQERGWRLLWNDNGTPRKERSAQDLFSGIVSHYCRANDIDLSREADVGRGPVDFKASRGYALRVLLELKLARNTRFWDGLEKQLPAYMSAERVKQGYFIVIVQSEADMRRLKSIQDRVNAFRDKTKLNIDTTVVDARRKASASQL